MNSPSTQESLALAGTHFLAGLIDGMIDAVWLVDASSLRVVAANAAAGTLLGVDAAVLVGADVEQLCATPEDMLFWNDVAAGLAQGIESQTWLRRADDATVPVTRRVSRLSLGNAADVFVVVLHDRSEQCRIEEGLEQRIEELAATLESTEDGLLVTDLAGRIRHFNRAFAKLWDIPDELLRRRDDAALWACMRRAVSDPNVYMLRLAAVEDSEVSESVDTVALRSGRVLQRVVLPHSSRGRVLGRVYCFRDVSERLESMRRIDALTRSDMLTGLPNRTALAHRVEFSIAMARRDDTPFALLAVNLDRFKQINDTLGHDFGDRVLIEVARRLELCTRQVDIVSRLGGDEFVVLVHQADAHGAETAARRILETMQQPFMQDGTSFMLTCSIGIALYPSHGSHLDELVRHADAAVREVKAAGRAAYRFHECGGPDEEERRARLRLDTAMREALRCGRFRLHYQPQVDMRSGRVLGAEALIRWTDPELGQVAPAEFIPVAERSGFIVAIGDWVLQQAIAQAARWHAQGRSLVVSVNVSAVQFHRAGFVDRVAQALQAAQLPPALLELELTESILLRDAQEALMRLQALSALGLKLAIDDFGTGYCSLGYLKRFPIHRLKIDRSFVRGLPSDRTDAGIVHAIVNLGRALQVQIVAEGVETEDQRRFLLGTGCAQYQGFLFAPALDSASFEARLMK